MDLTAREIVAIAPLMTTELSAPFEHRLAMRAETVESVLRGLFDDRTRDGEIARPPRLMAAIRHGVLNGGKRLRPFLVLESAALFGGVSDAAVQVAAALECVHCYSLIHDDLPAMDDDDLRRGQPTVHRAYDEATAILAGDALLTTAFDILAGGDFELADSARLTLVRGLARAAGIGGMVGGQMLDLAAAANPPDERGVITLQAMKTGALLRYACEAGAVVAGANPADRERLSEFGAAVGLAFQLADDLLDLTSDAATLGKAAGKDAGAGKATLVGLNGPVWARRQLDGLIVQAEALLEPFGADALMLTAAARFVAARTS